MGHSGGEQRIVTIMAFNPATRTGAIVFSHKENSSTGPQALSLAPLLPDLMLTEKKPHLPATRQYSPDDRHIEKVSGDQPIPERSPLRTTAFSFERETPCEGLIQRFS